MIIISTYEKNHSKPRLNDVNSVNKFLKMKTEIGTVENFQKLAEFSSEIRKLTLKRLQEIPEGFMNWCLNNTAMSFVDIVHHLINVDELFFEISNTKEKQFQWKLGSEEPHQIVDKFTYEAMIEKLKEFQLKRHSVIYSLDDSRMNEEITDENGKKMTFWWFLMQKVLEHEIYHRGQISAYLKVLKGESSKI